MNKCGNYFKEVTIAKSIQIIAWGYIIVSIILQCIASSYTPIQSDDWMKYGGYTYHPGDLIKSGYQFACDHYMNWQGCFTVTFIEGFLLPLRRYGHMMLRILMVLIVLLFFVMIIWTVHQLMDEIHRKKEAVLISALLVFMVLNYYPYTEIFYWFTGAVAYVVPFMFVLGALVQVIRPKKTFRGKALGLICAFAASGSPLNIVGIHCYLLGILVLRYWIPDKRNALSWQNRYRIEVFLIAFVGALVNVLAPGNYARHDVISNSLSVLQTIRYSISYSYREWELLFRQTNVIIVLAIMVFIGFYLMKKYQDQGEKGISSFMVLALLLMPAISCFPVIYGYGEIWLPERTVFILDFQIYCLIIILGYLLGRAVAGGLKDIPTKAGITILLLMTGIIIILKNSSVDELGQKQVAADLMNGAYQSYYETYMAAYEDAEEYGELARALDGIEGPAYYHTVY